jgi:hypothetical protein
MFRRFIRSPSSGLLVNNFVILKYRTNYVIKYTVIGYHESDKTVSFRLFKNYVQFFSLI